MPCYLLFFFLASLAKSPMTITARAPHEHSKRPPLRNPMRTGCHLGSLMLLPLAVLALAALEVVPVVAVDRVLVLSSVASEQPHPGSYSPHPLNYIRVAVKVCRYLRQAAEAGEQFEQQLNHPLARDSANGA